MYRIGLTAGQARLRTINSVTANGLLTKSVCVRVREWALITAERVAYFCKISTKVVSVGSHDLYPNDSKAKIALKQPDMAFTLRRHNNTSLLRVLIWKNHVIALRNMQCLMMCV